MYQINEPQKTLTDYVIVYRPADRFTALNLAKQLRSHNYIVETTSMTDELKSYIFDATYRRCKVLLEIDCQSIRVIDIAKDFVHKTNLEKICSDLDRRDAILSIH